MHRRSLFGRRTATGWVANITAAMRHEDLVSPLARHRRLRSVLWHVLDNLDQRLFCAQAAKIVSVERKYFSRFFLREAGFNFSWWNREIRIRLATQLLHQESHNIESVALEVGYADLTTFERAFKKCNGVAPRAYRRSRNSARASPAETSLASARAKDVSEGLVTTNADPGNGADAKSVESAAPPDRRPT